MILLTENKIEITRRRCNSRNFFILSSCLEESLVDWEDEAAELMIELGEKLGQKIIQLHNYLARRVYSMLFTFKDLKYVFLSHSFAFSQLQLQNVNVKVNGTKDETMDAAMIDVARFIKSYSTFSHFLIPSEKGVDG